MCVLGWAVLKACVRAGKYSYDMMSVLTKARSKGSTSVEIAAPGQPALIMLSRYITLIAHPLCTRDNIDGPSGPFTSTDKAPIEFAYVS